MYNLKMMMSPSSRSQKKGWSYFIYLVSYFFLEVSLTLSILGGGSQRINISQSGTLPQIAIKQKVETTTWYTPFEK